MTVLLQFRRHPRSPGAGGAAARHLADNPAVIQLLPLRALRAEAIKAQGPAALSLDPPLRAAALVRSAILYKEIARRTGELDMLARAASAARRAFDLAKGDRRLQGQARLRHGEILALSGALFADAEALRRAEEAVSGRPGGQDPVTAARAAALRAFLGARRALEVSDRDEERSAAKALAEAAAALERLGAEGRADASEGSESRCDLAELQLAAGLRSKDRALLEDAWGSLALAAKGLDAAIRPFTWARAETLRGQVLAAQGDLSGEPEVISEGAMALRQVVCEIDPQESPLDAARASHALGRVLQSLAELYEDEALFEGAFAAMGPALTILDTTPHLPLRALAAHDAALCLTRRAERRRDLVSLRRAEQVFRDALETRTGSKDPLAWAVTQVALARIYEAEAEITGEKLRLKEAGVALSAALDVFAEKGLRSLSEAALSAIGRLAGRDGAPAAP